MNQVIIVDNWPREQVDQLRSGHPIRKDPGNRGNTGPEQVDPRLPLSTVGQKVLGSPSIFRGPLCFYCYY